LSQVKTYSVFENMLIVFYDFFQNSWNVVKFSWNDT